jgi:putative transcriptional regulator
MADTDLDPRPGTVLISPPMLQDPNFRRTVVLLCEHNDEGSFGLILNRPLDIDLNDVLEDYLPFDDPVGLGGPVQRNTLHFIHRRDDLIPGSIELPNGVHWGGDFDQIKTLLQGGDLSGDDVRFFVGYAGWSPGQLQGEIDNDGWIVTQTGADVLFPDDPSTLWRSVLRSMGGEYAILANFPDDPRMN